MSERKVLNKYYPPDFDPSKIPKLKQGRNKQFGIRLMAPFNMRCNTCGEYIYKGKKFNSRKETVENEKYLGLYIFRFYIKCPRCIAEIAFKTDPENTDYVLEAGATRNFEAQRTAEKQAMKEQKEKEEEDAGNPMKMLENRTKASRQEMDMLETLEDLHELRKQHATVDTAKMLEQNRQLQEQLILQQEQDDDDYVKSIFSREGTRVVKRIIEDDASSGDDSDSSSRQAAKLPRTATKPTKPTDLLTAHTLKVVGGCASASKNKLQNLVRRRDGTTPPAAQGSSTTAPPCVASTNQMTLESAGTEAPSGTDVKPASNGLLLCGYSSSDSD